MMLCCGCVIQKDGSEWGIVIPCTYHNSAPILAERDALREVVRAADGLMLKFECGYGGSGPAELALNVLDALLPVRGGVGVSGDAWRLHQDFKRVFIEPMPREGGRVPIEDIQQWIAQRLIAEAA